MTEAQVLAEKLEKALEILREFVSDCDAAAEGAASTPEGYIKTVRYLKDEWYDLMTTYQRACWMVNSSEESGNGNV